MRTTVELPDEQYAALRTLAARRGVRGFSGLVSEAVDLLLSRERSAALEEALDLGGALDEEAADELEANVRNLRQRPWRTS